MRLKRGLALVLTIAALAVGQTAWAQTFTVTSSTSDNTTTFKIERSGADLPAQMVRYTTVSLTAFEDQHFSPVSGTLDFAAEETTKTIPVRWKSRACLTPEGKAMLTPENFFILTPLKS